MKPVPPTNADTEYYWQAASKEELVYQVCSACSHTLSYPRGVCPLCQAGELEWRTSKGRGTVTSFSVVHRAPTPAFKADVPYVLALVDFEEGFKLMMNILGDDAQETAIGDSVEVMFEPRGDEGAKVPQVRRIPV